MAPSASVFYADNFFSAIDQPEKFRQTLQIDGPTAGTPLWEGELSSVDLALAKPGNPREDIWSAKATVTVSYPGSKYSDAVPFNKADVPPLTFTLPESATAYSPLRTSIAFDVSPFKRTETLLEQLQSGARDIPLFDPIVAVPAGRHIVVEPIIGAQQFNPEHFDIEYIVRFIMTDIESYAGWSSGRVAFEIKTNPYYLGASKIAENVSTFRYCDSCGVKVYPDPDKEDLAQTQSRNMNLGTAYSQAETGRQAPWVASLEANALWAWPVTLSLWSFAFWALTGIGAKALLGGIKRRIGIDQES
ncbi:hypothetical protein MB46_18625 [Arthrobacter alpinus]|nr:hypothetical protein MB46_18625 [Arthrobacter alpinus]